MPNSAGSIGCEGIVSIGGTMAVVEELVVEEVVVAATAVLSVHHVGYCVQVTGVVVVVLFPYPSWYHLLKYIPSLSANSTSFLSIYLPFLLIVQPNPT